MVVNEHVELYKYRRAHDDEAENVRFNRLRIEYRVHGVFKKLEAHYEDEHGDDETCDVFHASVAEAAYQYSTVEDILRTAEEKGEKPFLIVLDGITDPHNLGAIIRTAECAGVHGIIIPQHRSVGLSPAAVKSSAGAVEYVKVARVNNLSRTIEQLQKEGVWFYAVTMNGTDYRKVAFDGGVALVIGAEEDGISRLVLEKCDQAVSLPMTGKIESLNASVAAGIMMYRVFDSRR